MKRRSFLGGVAAAAIVAPVALVSASQQPEPTRESIIDAMNKLYRQMKRDGGDQVFWVQWGPEPTEVVGGINREPNKWWKNHAH